MSEQQSTEQKRATGSYSLRCTAPDTSPNPDNKICPLRREKLKPGERCRVSFDQLEECLEHITPISFKKNTSQ